MRIFFVCNNTFHNFMIMLGVLLNKARVQLCPIERTVHNSTVTKLLTPIMAIRIKAIEMKQTKHIPPQLKSLSFVSKTSCFNVPSGLDYRQAQNTGRLYAAEYIQFL